MSEPRGTESSKSLPFAALGARLKEARLALTALSGGYVSQKAMGQLLGLAEKVYARYEAGERQAPLAIIETAAILSGFDRDALAFGPREAEPTTPSEGPALRASDLERLRQTGAAELARRHRRDEEVGG